VAAGTTLQESRPSRLASRNRVKACWTPLSLSLSLCVPGSLALFPASRLLAQCPACPIPSPLSRSAPLPHLDALLARMQVLRLARLHARDEVRVVAALAQLHLDVDKVLGAQVRGAAREEGAVALEDLRGAGGGRTDSGGMGVEIGWCGY